MNAKEYDLRLRFLQYLELHSRGTDHLKMIPVAFYDKLIDGLEVVANEYYQHKLSEITEEEIKQRSWDAVKKHEAGKRTTYQAWYTRGMRDVINLLKGER